MRTRTWLGVLVVVLALSAFPSVSTPTTTAAAYTPGSAECDFLGEINRYRVANGRSALRLSPTLGAAAEHHSQDMLRNDYFSHTLSNGSTWGQNILAYGYPSASIRGENIAAGRESAAEVFVQWRNSAPHDKNMLDSRFNAIGIGFASDSSSRYDHYWTTTFGSVVDSTVSCSGQSVAPPVAGQRLTIVGGGRTGYSSSSSTVYDGNLSTRWYTTWPEPRSAGYVWVDLGSVKQVGTIEWQFTRGGLADRFSVQVSNDRSTWTTLTTRGTAYSGTWRSVSHSGQARYVRFYFENPNNDAQVGYLAEIRVYS